MNKPATSPHDRNAGLQGERQEKAYLSKPDAQAKDARRRIHRLRVRLRFPVRKVLPLAQMFVGCMTIFVACLAIALIVKAEELTESPISEADREYWSFRPLVRPDVPALQTGDAANPIDMFLEQRLRKKDLVPLGRADRTTLLRRVTIDLIGLPPTLEEIASFLNDAAPEAYERVVDRLLASPGFGERWGQHWLDLARFAETDGFEFDAVRPNAWRYRDWVIAAFNRDLPFDRFVQQQIAGDELWPDDPQAVVATGFLLCGPDMPDINDQDERRHTILNELTGTVGSVFLGLSVGCAQCHDHKIDPISQPDFFRLRAFFDRGDIFKDHPIATPNEQTAYEAARQATAPLEKELKQLDDAARKRLREQNPDLQPTAADLKGALTEDERTRRDGLSAELARLPKVPELAHGRVFQNGGERTSVVAIRGDFKRPGPEVQPAFLRIADSRRLGGPPDLDSERGKKKEEKVGRAAQPTGGRLTRSDLARWMTRADHPLVPRVMANRLWQFHFGAGLCRSPSDFGYSGSDPSHPELLDWLASELTRDGGSLKRMHRVMVTSAAYQRAARPGTDESSRVLWAALQAADPDNRWCGRMTPRRLEGEAIRDAMLSAAGVLSERRGGPGARPPLPKEMIATLLKNQWTVSPDEEDHQRRSIHLMVRRNLRYPLFEVFDRPDTNATCAKRSRSTVAPQALALLNSELSLSLAETLASRITREVTGADLQVQLAFQLVLGRHPTGEELAWSNDFLREESRPNQTDQRSALHRLCLALFNANEFLYVD